MNQLAAVEDRLAFGRLDLADGSPRYVGRIGLSDDARTQLLVDWRAPAAAAFYQATAAAPLDVIRRRHLATRGRTVTGLDDELLDVDALARLRAEAGEQALPTFTGEGALMSALTARRTGRMRDIVATLQAEQDAVVRAPLPGVLVVQGGPGTGKTAVALHRAAYLLYTHRDRIARSGVLIIGPSPVFLRYIEQVLPSLGETGVVLSTLGQLFPGVEATAMDPPELVAIKGDLCMARVVRNAVRDRQRLPGQAVPLRLDGDTVTLRPGVVAEARSRARQTGKPHNEARVTFVDHVLGDLVRQLAAARRLSLDEDGLRGDLAAELRASRDVRREVNLCWMPLTPQGLLTSLYTRPDRLAAASERLLTPEQRAALARPADHPWTLADVALLDEAAELIGPPVTSVTEEGRRRRERTEALDYARGVLEMAGELGAMLRPEMLADRFADAGPARTLAERAAEDRDWAFGHVVIDEAQELSAMQWRVVLRRVPSRSLTVVGDVAQTGSPAGASSWGQVLDRYVAGRWQLRELTVNYRTPRLVMDLAGALLAAHGQDVKAPDSARDGDWPPIGLRPPTRSTAAVAATVRAALVHDEESVPGGRFAVVTTRAARDELATALSPLLAAEALAAPAPGAERGPRENSGGSDGPADAEPLAARVSVLRADEVKGLEYDAVVVVDPAAMVAESPRGVNDLYVALTRPTQRLAVVHHGDLPAGLESLGGSEHPVGAANRPSRP